MENYSQANSQDSLSSSRLQKAIERNRAKQKKREMQGAGKHMPPPPPPPRSPAPSRASTMRQNYTPRPRPRPLPEAEARTNRYSQEVVAPEKKKFSLIDKFNKAANSIRKTVGIADEIEFTDKIRTGSKAPAKPAYKNRAKARRGSKAAKNQTWIERLVIAGWVFSAFVFLRLVFAERGVIDYYKKKTIIDNKNHQYSMIEAENVTINKEIERILKSKGYQKKIVRDHLGFIAQDEYLVLFPGDQKRK